MISFNIPPHIGTEEQYIAEAIKIIKYAEMEFLQKSAVNG